ncbi:reverse transcriptase domain-containing protein [Vogesella facilis]|uniref:Reverse transcriptase domain-containing protein n=1 Tax=Vogesella facilis TaxID=1655232 RepID=A0ABV7RI38_9NEIS
MPKHSTLHTLLSYPHLEQSWRGLFSSTRPTARNTIGIDGISINDFSTDPIAHLRNLSNHVRSPNFQFQKLKPHIIPKVNGKYRLICVPTVNDRIVQRSLLIFLSEKYQKQLANNISFGFIKDRGIQKAARTACFYRTKKQWVLKTDIQSFFDNIDRNILAASIKRSIKEKSLHNILISASSCEIFSTSKSEKSKILALGIIEGHGIRQGMPLSPFFSNLILSPFDHIIIKKKILAVRYADDLIFFATSRSECEDIFQLCQESLSTLGLHLPSISSSSKSIIYEPDQPAEFLGLGLCKKTAEYKISLLPEQREKIRQRILDLGSIKELLARKINLSSLGKAIDNRISGYLSAYDCCDNIEDLERELHDLGMKVKRRVLFDELKIPYSSLSSEARRFLGV